MIIVMGRYIDKNRSDYECSMVWHNLYSETSSTEELKEGVSVGEEVRPEDGATVGPDDVSAVGPDDGATEGDAVEEEVGPDDGATEGRNDGTAVGLEDGTVEGLEVGVIVGGVYSQPQ